MTIKDYLAEVIKCEVIDAKVAEIKKVYNKELPDIIKQIVSYSEESVFFDNEWRTLSFSEIVEAEKDLHVDFVKLGIIPVIDCGENDFIVYHFDDGVWSKFNIIDECSFKKKEELSGLF